MPTGRHFKVVAVPVVGTLVHRLRQPEEGYAIRQQHGRNQRRPTARSVFASHQVSCWSWGRSQPLGDASASTRSGTGEALSQLDLWHDFGVKRGYVVASGNQLVLQGSTNAMRNASNVDSERVRNMRGELVPAAENPGLRVEPNFVDETEEEELARELREIVRMHGFCFDNEKVEVRVADASGTIQTSRGEQRAKRVTGRPETRDGEAGVIAPWGYGADLDSSKLPPGVRRLVAKLRSTEGYKLGPLRDCTINHRTGSFFMIHPHVDPLMDGPHVFVLGLLSGAILTFSPKDASPRTGVEVEQRSWTDDDLDVIIRRRSLVGFTGPARYDYRHGIRAGMEIQSPELGDSSVICDFWGSMNYMMPRRQERFSVVLSFADRADT